MLRFNKLLLIAICSFVLGNSFAQKWVDMMNDPTVNFYLVQKEANAYFDSVGTGRGTGYKHFKRWEYETQMTCDKEGNRLQPSTIKKAHAKQKAKDLKNRSQLKKSNVVQWQELGPDYWDNTTGWNPGVGRIKTFALDPNTPGTIYAGSEGGGLWKTTNDGNTWIPLTDDLGSMDIRSVTVNWSNSSEIMIGLNDYLGGVYRSTNGGITWNEINYSDFLGTDIHQIKYHPTNSSIIFVASNRGLYRSQDNGTSWTKVMTDQVEDIEFKPGDPSIVYVSGNYFYRSDNSGISFNQITNGLENKYGRAQIAVTPAAPNHVYFIQAQGGVGFGGLYLSTNGGLSFQTQTGSSQGINYFSLYRNDGNFSRGQTWHNLAFDVSPNNPDEIHFGAINGYRSFNGGIKIDQETYWDITVLNGDGYYHADVHQLQFTNGSTIYSASDGGMYKSTDNGLNWTDISRGLGIKMFYRIGVSKTNSTIVTGGTQDNGTSIRTASGDWKDWLGADGMETFIDPTNENIIYSSIQNGRTRYRSEDGGNSRIALSEPTPNNGNWITPFSMDQQNTSTIYTAVKEVYKSTNKGDTWVQVSSFNDNFNASAMAIAPSNGSIIYVSKLNDLYKTINGGNSWSQIGDWRDFDGSVNYICISPADPNKLAAVTSNHVYKSLDGGSSWTRITKGLVGTGLTKHTIAWRNDNNETLYLGTDIGIYTTNNTKSVWDEFSVTLPNVQVRDLKIHEGDQLIYAATFGRGLWVADLPGSANNNNPPIVSITSPQNNEEFTINSTVTISATATADQGVKEVIFTAGNQTWTDNTFPYEIQWTPTSTGTVSIQATAVSTDDLTSTATIQVTIIEETAGCTQPEWDATATYVNGNEVARNNKVYRANWWNRNTDPAQTNGPGTPWTFLEECQGTTNQAPTASIVSHANGDEVSIGVSFTIAARANDIDGNIASVSFKIKGNTVNALRQGTDWVANYTPTELGSLTIHVESIDNEGLASNLSFITLTVTNGQTVQPTVSIVSPNNSQNFEIANGASSTTINIAVDVNDEDITIDRVEYKINEVINSQSNIRLINSNSAPFNISFEAVKSDKTEISAIAYSNNLISPEKRVTIFVNEAVTNSKPTLSITNPVEDQSFTYDPQNPSPINVSVNANDVDGSITSVSYQVTDGAGTFNFNTSSSPFSMNYTPRVEGAVTITAFATDDDFENSEEDVVSFSVSEQQVSGCSLPQWNSTDAYVGSTNVQYNGTHYRANYWNQNKNPEQYSSQPWSEWKNMGPCSSNSAASINRIDEVMISPNPSQGTIQVTAFDQEAFETTFIEVVNAAGTTIFRRMVETNETTISELIDLSTQPKGIYYLSITTGDAKRVEKLFLE